MTANKFNNYQVAGEVLVSTTGNIDNLDTEGCSVVRMANATVATIRGLKAGFPGQLLLIASVGAGNVFLAHQNAGSSAANRLINFATSADTPLSGGAGVALYEYDGTSARWRLVSHDQGNAIQPAFSAGNFTASGAMTWTVDIGDIAACNYILQGRVLNVTFSIATTSVGGTPSNFLQIESGAFGGFTIPVTEQGIAIVAPAGTNQLGFMQASSAGRLYFAADLVGTLWTAPTTNTTYVALTRFSFLVN